MASINSTTVVSLTLEQKRAALAALKPVSSDTTSGAGVLGWLAGKAGTQIANIVGAGSIAQRAYIARDTDRKYNDAVQDGRI